MAHNMLVSMQQSGVTNLVLVSLDEDSNACLKRRNIRFFHESFTAKIIDSKTHDFLEGSYEAIVGYKMKYLLRLVTLGFDVVVTDTDTVWPKNPLPMVEHARADAAFPGYGVACDGCHCNTTTGCAEHASVLMDECVCECPYPFWESVMGWPGPMGLCPWYTGGWYFVSHQELGQQFARKLVEHMSDMCGNQPCMEQQIMGTLMHGELRHQRFWHFSEGQIIAGFDLQYFHEKMKDPMVVHANWIVGHDRKRTALQINDMWYLP
eukprot:TRINITY_DN10634_c0_g1_i1.p1 TRINITY_DN10634_c0_g1~~TRINITY_DN10634_c0_g1_i1.p1  ORF type:complete len:264 (+),score=34.34 TRINITY_DN10634_c0_g1_i1:153-944(+)